MPQHAFAPFVWATTCQISRKKQNTNSPFLVRRVMSTCYAHIYITAIMDTQRHRGRDFLQQRRQRCYPPREIMRLTNKQTSHPRRAKMTVRVNQKRWYSLVPIGTDASRLVVFCAIVVRAVIKRAIPASDRPPPPLVHEMPVETGERSMLCTFVLQEERALLDAKLFQIPGKQRTFQPVRHTKTVRVRCTQRHRTLRAPKIHLRVMIRFFRLSCQQRFRL